MDIISAGGLINLVYNLLYWLILARIILSFIAVNPHGNSTLNQARKVVYNLTEPIMAPFRKIIPPVRLGGGYLDLTPIIVIVLLGVVRNFLLRAL